MKTLFLVAILVIASTLSVRAQSGCLCIPRETFEGKLTPQNSDSLFAIDTCLVPNNVACDSLLGLSQLSKYNAALYTRRYYFSFDMHNYFSLPSLPYDSMVFVTWQQIDTSFPATRAAFAAIEARFGSFLMRKISPNLTDTLRDLTNTFIIYFKNLQFADSLSWYFFRLPGRGNQVRPIPIFSDTYSSVNEFPEHVNYTTSLILNKCVISVPEIAQKRGWKLMNVMGQIVREFPAESYSETVSINDISPGIYVAIFPTCTSLILLTGDNQ